MGLCLRRKKEFRVSNGNETNGTHLIRKIIPLLFIGLLVFGLVLVAGIGFQWYYTGSKPGQPIAFSHKVHIDTVGLKCTHCHVYADKSPQAGVPAVKVCADCHEKVAADRPEIKKLMEYWKNQEPIPWTKVHVQKWHVHFTHKRHIKAGIDCSHCHGEVKAMDTVRKVRSLEMGWCVTCHRQNNAPTDCWTCHK
jgi:hypothetical protein